MSAELQAAFKEKYPKGYSDYCGDLFKVEKPDGSCFYAVSVEIPDALYLVKIDVKIDALEDIENALDEELSGSEGEDEERDFPDDNVDQYEDPGDSND